MSYKPCDRIFAKVKGFPHWPARINILPQDVRVPKGKYPIFFYGTHEVYFLAPKDIYPYEQWKHKYAVNKSRPLFQKGLEEIENEPDILLYGKDANAEQFLSQFYKFAQSTASGHCNLSEESTNFEVSGDDAINKGPDNSSNISCRLSSTKHVSKGQRRRLTHDHDCRPSDKNMPKNNELQPVYASNEDEKLTTECSLETKREPLQETEKDVTTTALKTSAPRQTAATTALGRPMRKSASKFSAMKLLKAGMPTLDDEGSSEDADWHPPLTDRKAISSVSADTPSLHRSSTDSICQKVLKKQKGDIKLVTSESLKCPSHSSDEKSSTSSTDPGPREDRKRRITRRIRRCKKQRFLSPSPVLQRERSKGSSSIDRPRLKLSNVSMTAEELSSRLNNRANQQNGQKQLEELGAEARLHRIDIAIKTSLIRGQEDIPACLQRLEALEKMELSLPVLVKCSAIVDTIRKCSRYKPSMDVRIAALKVFNLFLKIRENASKDEMDQAHAELVVNNKRLPTSNAQAGPSSVAEIFKGLQQPQPNSAQQKLPVSRLKSPTQSVRPTSPTNAKLQPTPPAIPSSPPHPPTPSCDVLPLHSTISPQDQPKISIQEVPRSRSPSNASDSEGLAPSLGDLEGEESLESGEDPLLPPPPNPLFKSLNAEATVAAVKQVFLQRAREKMAATNTRVQQPAPLPTTETSPSTMASQSETCVPQSLHSCSGSYLSYVPIPTDKPFQLVPPSSAHQASLDVELNQPALSPEGRRRPGRERARSPHALPHPLEHYQRFLRNGDSSVPPPTSRPSVPLAPPQPYARAVTDDLDTRIARLLEAATPHSNQRPEFQPPTVLSPPPPPPPPLPPSQNLILSHRPLPLPTQPFGVPINSPPAYTPASPIPDGNSDDQCFDPLIMWSSQQNRGADDVYKNMDS